MKIYPILRPGPLDRSAAAQGRRFPPGGPSRCTSGRSRLTWTNSKIALTALLLSVGSPVTPASAGETAAPAALGAQPTATETGSSGVLSVCPGNDLVLTSADGRRLAGDRLLALVRTVKSVCDHQQGDGGAPSGAPLAAATQGYVRADLTRTKATLYASGSAWGLYYNFKTGTPRNEVTCIYRKTGATKWNDCGYGTGTTSVTTSTLSICPRAGVYEGYAQLFVNGQPKLSGYDTAVVG